MFYPPIIKHTCGCQMPTKTDRKIYISLEFGLLYAVLIIRAPHCLQEDSNRRILGNAHSPDPVPAGM